MIPAILLEILGSAVASQVSNASDPISGLPAALPAWFLIPYLVVLFVNLLSVNGIESKAREAFALVIFASDALVNQSALIIAEKILHTLIDMIINIINYVNMCLESIYCQC